MAFALKVHPLVSSCTSKAPIIASAPNKAKGHRRAVSSLCRAAAAPIPSEEPPSTSGQASTTLVHFIGIGGTGVSALAVIALSQAS